MLEIYLLKLKETSVNDVLRNIKPSTAFQFHKKKRSTNFTKSSIEDKTS